MEEALLVQQALQGGPSGPGTGIRARPGGVQMGGMGGMPQMGGQIPGSPVPGFPMPGSSVPGSPISGFPMPGSTVPGSPVSGFPMPGSPIPGSPVPGSPIPGMDFLGGGGPPQPQNFEQRFNSGMSGGTFGQTPTQFGGLGSGQQMPTFIDPTTGQQAFPVSGEASSGSILGHGSSSGGAGQFSGTAEAPRSTAEVTSIQEDAFGFFYVFHADPNGSGIRVNITKGGFCNRPTEVARPVCINMCYSDDQCPRNLKCCPSSCALECSAPLIPDIASAGK